MAKKYYAGRAWTAVILTVVAALLIAAWAVLLLTSSEKSAQEWLDLGIEEESVSQIFCEYNGESCRLLRGDGDWYNPALPGYTVDQDVVSAFLHNLEKLKIARTLTETDKYAGVFGLDEPLCHVKVVCSDGTAPEFQISAYMPGINGYYLCINGVYETSYILRSTQAERFFLRQVETVEPINLEGLTPASVLQIQIQGDTSRYKIVPNDKTLFLKTEWAVEGVYDATVPAYDNRVAVLISDLQTLQDNSRVAYIDTEETLRQYGLDNAKNSITVSYQVGSTAREYTVLFGEPLEDGSCYFYEENGNIVFQLSQEDSTAFLKKFGASYFLPKYFFAVELEQVSQLVIQTAGQEAALSVVHGEAGNRYYCDGKQVAGDAFETFFTDLTGLSCEGYVIGGIEMPDHISDVVTVQLIGTDGRTETLTLQRYDDNFYFASIGGLEYCLVSKMDVSEVKSSLENVLKGWDRA